MVDNVVQLVVRHGREMVRRGRVATGRILAPRPS